MAPDASTDSAPLHGELHVVLTGPDGEVKYDEITTNLITQVGEQLYGERAVNITTVAFPTGMHLGTSATAPAKTGAGAAIGAYVTGSNVAFDNSTPTSSIPGTVRRITYHATWAAGTATASGIAEVVITNQAAGTNSAAGAANTIARALLSPAVSKGASDSLAITWNHDIGT